MPCPTAVPSPVSIPPDADALGISLASEQSEPFGSACAEPDANHSAEYVDDPWAFLLSPVEMPVPSVNREEGSLMDPGSPPSLVETMAP